jgi:LacI family transcriptional regulator
LPPERELAAEFKVGRTTIQLALNELEALNLIVRRPNCRPVVSRQSAIVSGSKQGGQIAVWIMPEVQDLGGLMMLDGIRGVCAEEGYQLVVGGWNPRSPQSAENAEVEFLRRSTNDPSVAGVIVWEICSPEFAAIYREMLEKRTPIVFIDRYPAGEEEVDVVSVNHMRAAKIAVRTLLKLGHERIVMALGDDQATSIYDRIQGYRQALWEADLSCREAHMFRVCGGDSAEIHASAVKELRRILAEPDPPTAIFAANDLLALHLLEAAKDLGVKVPEQLSIIGFDWLMRWQPSGGHLTTVAQPFEEIGRAACRRLLEIVRSTVRPTARHILLEASVVVRETTAAAHEYKPAHCSAPTFGGDHG